nr:hypothetical protein [Tanacetum cinerariifolium]
MKESKAYMTYLGYVTGKRVKRSNKKSSNTQTTSIVIREPPVEIQSKRKEKVDVARGKGIDLLYECHPSGSGSVAETPPSVEKITPLVTSEGTSDKLGVLDVTKDESTESELESWGNDSEEHESDSEQDIDGSESDSKCDQQDDEIKDDDEDDDDQSEGDEDKGMDSDDVQDEKANVGMTDAQQEKENLEITQEQVVEDALVTITKKTEVPVTSSSHSSDLASKFLNFSDIPPVDTENISLLNVHVHHEVPIIHTSTLLAIPVSVIPEASPVYTNIPQSSQTFTSLPL